MEDYHPGMVGPGGHFVYYDPWSWYEIDNYFGTLRPSMSCNVPNVLKSVLDDFEDHVDLPQRDMSWD